MKQYDIYLFDLDGTITDTTGVWIQIFRDCLAKFGVDTASIPDDEIAKHTHDWKAVVNLGINESDIPAFSQHAKELANKRLPAASMFPMAYETLATMRAKGKRVGIYSTMDRPIFEPAIAHTQLDAVAEVCIAGTDVANRKPAPDGIFKALDDLGLHDADRSTIVYMGDKDTDIQAAHNAGIDAFLFFPAAHQLIYDKAATLAHNPETVLTDWQELFDSLDA
jgi:pyrophosphatase PpaX